ncbi:MAG TPA: hypothetical protein VFE50_19185 [Cyclobacteriaceae bacterium]|nr:hypothetical protein [Cyclobacteriaceae bacterium]
MGKLLSSAFIVFSVSILSCWGQIKKQFTVESPEACQAVELHMKAKVGNCFIRPSQAADILNIYSNQDLEEYGHSFKKEMKEGTVFVKLNLEQENQRGVGQMISNQVFGSDDKVTDKLWKVYLTDSKPYSLDLVYGLGNANVDLSGLAIKRLKINTGSADVNVSYSSGLENKVEMDTFFVKVDVGSLNVKQLSLSKSKVVLVDVGFGNMYLDFSNRPLINNHVKGSVGAGNLIISLPSDDVPVLVKVNESWLCSVSLSKSLQRIGENTFANAAYEKHSADALTFDLDVSLGKIIFKEK